MARERLVGMSLGGRTFHLEQETGEEMLWLVELGDRARSANRFSGEAPLAIFTQGRWLLAGRTPVHTAKIDCALDASHQVRASVLQGTKGWMALMPEGKTVDVTINFRSGDGGVVASHELALDWQDPPWDARPLRARIGRWLRRPKRGVTDYGP
jgi:hypothetical protein